MKRFLSVFSAFLVIIALCGCALGAESQAGVTEGTDGLEIHFIDVGQGDATLIKCGDKAMLWIILSLPIPTRTIAEERMSLLQNLKLIRLLCRIMQGIRLLTGT